MPSTRDQLIEGIFEDFASFRRVMMSRSEHLGQVVPRAQMEALFIVVHKGDMRIKDLADRMRVTGSAATQVVEALVRDGLLERTTDVRDRRIVRVNLTASGRERIATAKQTMLADLRRIMDRLGEDDLATLHGLLKKIIAANQ